MPEHQDTDRQAQLRMAAEALVEWLHARRATWSSEPFGIDDLGEFTEFSEAADAIADAEPPSSPRPFAAPPELTPPPAAIAAAPAFAAAPPVFVDALPPTQRPVAFDIAAVFDADPPVARPKKPRVQLRFPTTAVRSLVAPLVRVARRAAPVAAVLAVVVGAGWMAHPYVGQVKTWLTGLTGLTESTEAPKTEAPKAAAVAKPTPLKRVVRAGQLSARSDPAGAKVLVDGRERGVTPLTLDDVPIGQHTVVLQSDKGSVRRTVTVASDRAAVVSESIFGGWLNVYAPFELQVTEGARTIRLDENGKVLLPSGPHDLRLENRELGYLETRRVEVQPGETTALSLVVSPSMLTVTASAPAVVLVDGQQVGATPLASQPIALGTRDIVVRAADGTERRFTTKITVAPVQIDVDFSKP